MITLRPGSVQIISDALRAASVASATTTNVSLLKSRFIIHSITGHSANMFPSLQAFHNLVLVLRKYPSKSISLLDLLIYWKSCNSSTLFCFDRVMTKMDTCLFQTQASFYITIIKILHFHSLLPDYQRLLSSTPSRRLNTSKLIENSEYFQNKLVDTIHFMEILSLKDSVEKDTFFRKLPNLAEQLPRQIVLKKLLPLLASALEFGSAAAPALTALLKMGSWLSAEEFCFKILPTIIKLFAFNDRVVRVSLLQHIQQFGESLSAQAVDEQVYPHVATGFSDTSTFFRGLTFKSMLVLAPKPSQRTLSGSLLKHLSKLQVDEEAAIPTNTTILLGNIASYLNEGTRKRVLINAFTVRALRDTFPPARGAGIMALCATSSNYDITEIATRILPNVVVLTIDPDSDVRSKAFQAIDQFLQMAKQNYEKTNIAEATGGAGTGSSSIPGNASLLGWAMSSLTLKGKHSDYAPVASVSSSALTSTSSNATSAVDTPSTAPIRVSSTPDFTEHHAPPSSTSTDGWGELENGIDEEPENDKDW
ncbi:uncharacterized protein LOC127131918 [Lathyrus oleraceus]|uniref:uncharacterized protein LOC127131918 n=1 Tax=Pisum sativum TaxID=3888 RepID=UPI0021CE43F1|nr:uncharacterized protein LOC127131918 [Pisum sativum]